MRARARRRCARAPARPDRVCCADSGGSEMSGGSGGGGGGGSSGGSDARRPSTCRVELGSLLAPEPRPHDNKVKVRTFMLPLQACWTLTASNTLNEERQNLTSIIR